MYFLFESSCTGSNIWASSKHSEHERMSSPHYCHLGSEGSHNFDAFFFLLFSLCTTFVGWLGAFYVAMQWNLILPSCGLINKVLKGRSGFHPCKVTFKNFDKLFVSEWYFWNFQAKKRLFSSYQQTLKSIKRVSLRKETWGVLKDFPAFIHGDVK